MQKRNFGGWVVLRVGEAGAPNTVYHTMPIGDDKDHLPSNECWCAPTADDGYPHYVHRSEDGREEYEHGLRKPH